MKKILMTLVAAMMMASTAFAQEDNTVRGTKPSTDEMAQRMTEKMVQKYGLNDTQKAKLLELNKNFASKMPRLGFHRGGPRHGRNGEAGDSIRKNRPSSEQMTARRQEMQQTREEYNTQLKGIMTDEQYSKYTADEKNRLKRQPMRAPRSGDNNGGED